jgi:cardiolipin synthase
MNLPNLLTILRILLIPFFIIALSYQYQGLALVVFACAGLTDALDGFIARTFQQKTLIGAYLDPIADKLLLGTSFVTLTVLSFPNKIPFWLTIVIISRDVIILLGIAILFMLGKKLVIAPSLLGKSTTFFQILIIAVVLLFNYLARPIPQLITLLAWITLAVTVVSGLDYLYKGIKLLNEVGM